MVGGVGQPAQMGALSCAHRSRRLQVGPILCMPLNNNASLLWCPRLPQIPSCWSPYSCLFGLSFHSQQLSPPWVHAPNPTFQHTGPLHAIQTAAHRTEAQATGAVLALSCLPQTIRRIPLQYTESPFLSQLISPTVGISRLQLLARIASSFFNSFFLSFPLPGREETFIVFLVVWSILLIFIRCSVIIVPFAGIYLMYLWGETSSISSYSAISTLKSSALFCVCVCVCVCEWELFNVLLNRLLQFFKFIYFYWRIIALQNFAVSCQTSTWIIQRYTSIPSLLNLPPNSLPIPSL